MPLTNSSESNPAFPSGSQFHFDVAYHFVVCFLSEKAEAAEYLKALASHHLLMMEYNHACQTDLKIETDLSKEMFIPKLHDLIVGDFMFSILGNLKENEAVMAQLKALTNIKVSQKIREYFGENITDFQLHGHIQFRERFCRALERLIQTQEKHDEYCAFGERMGDKTYHAEIQKWVKTTFMKIYFDRALFKLNKDGYKLDNLQVQTIFKNTYKMEAELDSDEFFLLSYEILEAAKYLDQKNRLKHRDPEYPWSKSLSTCTVNFLKTYGSIFVPAIKPYQPPTPEVLIEQTGFQYPGLQ